MRGYDLLLRLYPRSFRNEYGREMRAIFARRRREATRPVQLMGRLFEKADEDPGSPTVRALRIDPISVIRDE